MNEETDREKFVNLVCLIGTPQQTWETRFDVYAIYDALAARLAAAEQDAAKYGNENLRLTAERERREWDAKRKLDAAEQDAARYKQALGEIVAIYDAYGLPTLVAADMDRLARAALASHRERVGEGKTTGQK